MVTAPELAAVLVAVAAGPRPSVVLDLGDVSFIDARGLGAVAQAVADLRPSGRRLTLHSVSRFRRRLLAITGLDQLVDVDPPADEPAVAVDLARTMALPADQAVLAAALRLVVAVAKSTVIGADGVSISLARHGRVRTVAATDATVAGMDEDQYLSDEGPCLDAAAGGQGVYVTALAEEERWPGFVPRAQARGIKSVLSTPLRLSEEPTGALNMYSFTPTPSPMRSRSSPGCSPPGPRSSSPTPASGWPMRSSPRGSKLRCRSGLPSPSPRAS